MILRKELVRTIEIYEIDFALMIMWIKNFSPGENWAMSKLNNSFG